MLLSFCQCLLAKDQRGSLAIAQIELTAPYRGECSGIKEVGFCFKLDIVRKWGDFTIGYLNNSYLEGILEQGKKYNWKEAVITHNSKDSEIFCNLVIWTMFR